MLAIGRIVRIVYKINMSIVVCEQFIEGKYVGAVHKSYYHFCKHGLSSAGSGPKNIINIGIM